MSDPNLRAVPNPETSATRELIKTVALTSAVSALVGVFAVAGGEALFSWIKKAASVKKAKKAEAAQVAQAPPATPPRPAPPGNDYYYGTDYEQDMPEALRMQPHLRSTGSRRRRPSAPPAEMGEIRSWLEEFENRQNAHFDRLERRIEEGYEEEDEEEEEAG